MHRTTLSRSITRRQLHSLRYKGRFYWYYDHRENSGGRAVRFVETQLVLVHLNLFGDIALYQFAQI